MGMQSKVHEICLSACCAVSARSFMMSSTHNFSRKHAGTTYFVKNIIINKLGHVSLRCIAGNMQRGTCLRAETDRSHGLSWPVFMSPNHFFLFSSVG